MEEFKEICNQLSDLLYYDGYKDAVICTLFNGDQTLLDGHNYGPRDKEATSQLKKEIESEEELLEKEDVKLITRLGHYLNEDHGEEVSVIEDRTTDLIARYMGDEKVQLMLIADDYYEEYTDENYTMDNNFYVIGQRETTLEKLEQFYNSITGRKVTKQKEGLNRADDVLRKIVEDANEKGIEVSNSQAMETYAKVRRTLDKQEIAIDAIDTTEKVLKGELQLNELENLTDKGFMKKNTVKRIVDSAKETNDYCIRKFDDEGMECLYYRTDDGIYILDYVPDNYKELGTSIYMGLGVEFDKTVGRSIEESHEPSIMLLKSQNYSMSFYVENSYKERNLEAKSFSVEDSELEEYRNEQKLKELILAKEVNRDNDRHDTMSEVKDVVSDRTLGDIKGIIGEIQRDTNKEERNDQIQQGDE